jgi:glycine/D-amino acid oxidase-like deaminating enzyme
LNTLPSEPCDFLIVGQGLAGTLLSYFLLKEKQNVMVVDKPMPGACSLIAAGTINPVTGRRIAKSWRHEELFPFARQTYRELEAMLGASLWQDRIIYRALHNTFEENEWERRSAYPEYAEYLAEIDSTHPFESLINPPHAWGKLHRCAQVDIPLLVQRWRQELISHNRYLEAQFDYEQLSFNETRAKYRDIIADRVVFCEGAAATMNPYFSHLPFKPTKGELLLVRIPDAGFSQLIKHKLFIIPIRHHPLDPSIPADDLYWVGSSSRWEYQNPYPSGEQRKLLLNQLREVLQAPFEVVDHLAGIRPTVEDVRPLLGIHPEHQRLAVFNGLGTKGTSLGPYFAQQMAWVLMGLKQIEPDVDIGRFA